MRLDLGCGKRPKKGYLHFDLKKNSRHLEVRGSIYKLPFKDRAFDSVYIDNVFEHLFFPLEALKEVSRITRKATIKVPNKEYYYWKTSDSNNEHIFSWNEYSFRNFLYNGFKKVVILGSTRQVSNVNKKYALFLLIIKALFSRFNELTAICEN